MTQLYRYGNSAANVQLWHSCTDTNNPDTGKFRSTCTRTWRYTNLHVQVGRPLLITIQHVLNYCQVLHPQGATFSGIEARTLVDNLVQVWAPISCWISIHINTISKVQVLCRTPYDNPNLIRMHGMHACMHGTHAWNSAIARLRTMHAN